MSLIYISVCLKVMSPQCRPETQISWRRTVLPSLIWSSYTLNSPKASFIFPFGSFESNKEVIIEIVSLVFDIEWIDPIKTVLPMKCVSLSHAMVSELLFINASDHGVDTYFSLIGLLSLRPTQHLSIQVNYNSCIEVDNNTAKPHYSAFQGTDLWSTFVPCCISGILS